MIAMEVVVQPAQINADPAVVTLEAIDRVARNLEDDIAARLREFGPVEPFRVIVSVGVPA